MALDTPYSIAGRCHDIIAAGHSAVIRYISPNTENFPDKCLTVEECQDAASVGLWLAGVWEKMGSMEEMNSSDGAAFATAAVAKYQELGAGAGSTIWFAVDSDPTYDQIQNDVIPFFLAIHPIVRAADFMVGGYGSGAVLRDLFEEGLIHFKWLAGAYGWSESEDMLALGDWHLKQAPDAGNTTVAGISVDLDELIEGPPSKIGFWQIGGPAPGRG